MSAHLPRDRFAVNEPTTVFVEVRADAPLAPGAEIAVQFPQSWTMDRCASFTKEYQGEDSAAPQFLKVSATGDARFEWRVEKADFDTGDPVSRHGRRIFITVAEGEVPAGEPVLVEWRNTLASRRAETELVHVAINGQRLEPLPEIITDPGPEVRLRVIAPSSVAPGQQFLVRIVSLDAYDNASATWHHGDVLLGPEGEALSGPLHFQGVRLVPVTLNAKGVYRLSYRGKLSNPIRVTATPRGPYWGDTHIHSRWSHDAIGRFPYEYARDVSGLDFAAVCDHAESAILGWDKLVAMANAANDPGQFVTLVAYENGLGPPSGHYNTYYRGDAGRCYLKPEFGADISRLNEMLDPAEAMTIPHHTAIAWGHSATGSTVDWEKCDPRFSPVVEIYSHHGQSERYDPTHVNAYEFNRWHKPGERTNRSIPGHFAQDAWRMGVRVGVICSSDDHYGQGGMDFEGIAGVFADELTREGIWDAIRTRQCYGTTGERILLDLRVNGTEMGQETTAAVGEELSIELEVHGTDALARVEVLRLDLATGEYTTILDERPYELDFAGTVTEEFSGPVMYYARVQQEKMINHRAVLGWSSPIWVD